MPNRTIEFDLQPADLLFVRTQRVAGMGLVKAAYRLGFAAGPLIGLLLVLHPPAICCLVPAGPLSVDINGVHDKDLNRRLNIAALILRLLVYGVPGTLAWALVWRRLARWFGRSWVQSSVQPLLDSPSYWGRRSLTINESGLRIRSPAQDSQIAWFAIRSIDETEKHGYFDPLGGGWFFIPKSAFAGPAEASSFVAGARHLRQQQLAGQTGGSSAPG